MKSREALGFAVAALAGHRLRSLLSLVGVAIGVASVILLTSLGEGARRYVSGEFESLGTNLVIVIPGKTDTTGVVPLIGGAPNDLTLDDAFTLGRRIPQIKRVAPLVLGTATARAGTRARDVTVAGTTAEMLAVRKLEIRAGRYLPAGDPDSAPRVCVIGATVARELYPDTNPLGEILRLGDERFRVVGVSAPRGMTMGMDMDEVVTVPVRLAMRMYDRSSLFRIFVEVHSRDDGDAVRRAILAVLADRHAGDEDVTVLTQDSVLSAFDRILSILTAALGAIAAVSLVVAGVGIMNVMLVSVSERTAEIGLLKALGASRGQVLAVFLIEAAILSTTGGGIGLGVGFGAGRLLGLLYPSFPVGAPVWAVYGAVTVSVGVGLVFGVLPARRAAGLDPVRALMGR